MVKLESLKDVYEHFEKAGASSCATVDENGNAQIRSCGIVTYDEEGIYIRMMTVKPFYRQICNHRQVAMCANWSDDGERGFNDDGGVRTPPGFMVRLTGEVRELTSDEVFAKGEKDPSFKAAVRDVKVYPTTRVFVIHKGWAEVFDYDFEKEKRDHKLERARFSFGGAQAPEFGHRIDPEKCIGCGKCYDICTYDAITPGTPYVLDWSRCDECGNCWMECPAGAVQHNGLCEK